MHRYIKKTHIKVECSHIGLDYLEGLNDEVSKNENQPSTSHLGRLLDFCYQLTDDMERRMTKT